MILTKINNALIIFGLILCLTGLCFGQSNTDACNSVLPFSLKKAIKTQYPKYRIARSSDYSKEELIMQFEDKPNPCPAVASADADGDGTSDYALFIADAYQHTLLIAARNMGGKKWLLYELQDFTKEKIGSSYVEQIKAGAYEDLYANSPEYIDRKGMLRKYTSSRPGFIAGTIGSSGVAYFFSGNHWVHLCIFD